MEVGYEEKGEYFFEAKKLKAKHFQHEDPRAPKIFISELLLEEFSEELQYIIGQKINEIPEGLIATNNTIFAGRPWGTGAGRPPRSSLAAVSAPGPGTGPGSRWRYVRRDPPEGYVVAPPIRDVRHGGAVPDPGRA